MTAGDYGEVLALWNACEGVRASETPEELARILERNPGLSSVVRRGQELAAAVLCCHDGRRGYLYHLGVAAEFRKLGLGRLLIEHSLSKLKEAGISRCSIFLIVDNEGARCFGNASAGANGLISKCSPTISSGMTAKRVARMCFGIHHGQL